MHGHSVLARIVFSLTAVIGLTWLAWNIFMPEGLVWFVAASLLAVALTVAFNVEELRDQSLRRDPEFLVESYSQARAFAEQFTPQPGVDYRWAAKYAEDQFERVREEIERSETKANSIVNYGTAFSGASAAGFAVAATQTHWSLGFLALLVVFCAAQAIKYANDARLAVETPLPPQPTKAFEYADTYHTGAEARFGAQYVAAYMVAKICAHRKGKLLSRAARWFKVAVYLIVLGLLAVICVVAGGAA